MTIFSVYPYVVSDNFFKELARYSVSHSVETIHVNLDYTNLPRKHGRESIEHCALKKFAFQMLKEKGETDPRYEFNYYDVYAPNLGIIVECGNTLADKILEDLFRWGGANEVWILDYSDSNGVSELIKLKQREGG